jgi:SAM-dependent methyltransferase
MKSIQPDQPDSVGAIENHHRAIWAKPFLKEIYSRFYAELQSALPAGIHGAVIEVGAGAGFLKNRLPGLVSGDILPSRFIDVCFDAQQLPFRPGCLKGILMLNVFHHLPAAAGFLMDAVRCLAPGGVIAMIEPWMTAGSHVIYKLLHHEATEKGQPGWNFASSGPLSGANQALAWIVFERDRMIFNRRFPNLKIEAIRLHTPLRYLASGGLSHRFSAPLAWYRPMLRLEERARPLRRHLAMFATVILRRLP